MALKPRHYQLEVWQEAMRLVRQVYLLSEGMPDAERFGLQGQMRRAVVSVPSNIESVLVKLNGLIRSKQTGGKSA